MANGERRRALIAIMQREWKRLTSRPLYLFCMICAPLFCCVFFTTLMIDGLPTEMPIGIVDMDNTPTSRNLARNLDSFEMTQIVEQYPDIAAARQSMQKGDIYAFFLIPKDFSSDMQSQRQPKLSFYTNYSFLIAGSLLYKDMRMMCELAAGSAIRTTLYAKGATESQAMAFLQPIVIDTNAISNPWLNYSVYLSNTLTPAMLMIMIFMITVYSIGSEIKEGTGKQLLYQANNSITIALIGKLLPHTIIFTIMGIFYNTYLYGWLQYPCNSGIMPMLLATFCFVLASQSCGVLMMGVLPSLRLGLSFASLWGVISISISGFSFPVMAMHPSLEALSILFPLRHYFLIYVDQALNGYDIVYTWPNYVALLLFMTLPFIIANRIKDAFISNKYMP